MYNLFEVELNNKTELTNSEINQIIFEFKRLILEGKYKIELNENRDHNMFFYKNFNLANYSTIKALLNSFDIFDWKYCVRNKNIYYKHEILHIFIKNAILLNRDNTYQKTEIYLKIKLMDNYVVIVSLHENMREK